MLDVIRSRYSCRSFEPTPVSDDDLRPILDAAFCAPTANNARPWEIIVVRDAATRQKLSQVHQWARMCAESPVVLAMCGDAAKAPDWWIDDVAAATQNVLLAAESLGLGTCWVGVHAGGGRPETIVRDALGIPEHVRVLGLIALGTPGRPPPDRPDRYNEAAVHSERW
ncbi:MAG: nitroreductase family protein [Armatimonadota bacterium]|jgi:nitroreductase